MPLSGQLLYVASLVVGCLLPADAVPFSPPAGLSPFLLVEARQWVTAMQVATRRRITLRVFYHTSTWKQHWRDVITEQLLLMDGRRPANFFMGEHPFDQGADPCPNCTTHAGLRWLPTPWASVLDLADQLYLNVGHLRPGDFEAVQQLVEGLPIKHRAKLLLHKNQTVARQRNREVPANASGLSAGEVSTFMAMHDHCIAEHAAGRKAFVLYLHSKGACCTRREQFSGKRNCVKTNQKKTNNERFSIVAWRELMNTFSIEFPSVCLRALLEGYVACGANLLSFMHRHIGPHFSGTFFWANCDHLAALPRLANPFDAWAVELWPFKVSRHLHPQEWFAFNCAFNAHRCHWLPYRKPCLRSSYRSKLLGYLQREELPPSDVATRDISAAWVRQHCHPLLSHPYTNAPFWTHPSAFPFRPTKP
eukprot:EG_transcript_12171